MLTHMSQPSTATIFLCGLAAAIPVIGLLYVLAARMRDEVALIRLRIEARVLREAYLERIRELQKAMEPLLVDEADEEPVLTV